MADLPKRRRFWIDTSLQLRMLAFVMLLLSAGLALAFLSMDRGLEQAAAQTQRIFIPVDWARSSLRAPFLLTSAIVLLAGGVVTLLWSHRMIGPLLVLTAGIRRIREGNLKVDVRTRDSDSLRETIDDFSGMQTALRRKVTEDRKRLRTIEQRLSDLSPRLAADAAGLRELSSIREELKKITSFFEL